MAMPDDSRSAGSPAGIVNVEQAQAWQGEEEHWVAYDEQYNAGVRRHGQHLFAAAAIAPTDRVLDLGCGCGETTREAARLAARGAALGVDLSARMIERARECARAEGLTNVRFEQADAQVYPFEVGGADVAISRFGAMFFANPVAAFQNVGRGLRPGGRVALLAWQELGQQAWLQALRGALAAGRTLPSPPADGAGPFGFADPARVKGILDEAGFVGVACAPVHEPVCMGANPAEAFAYVQTMGVTRGLLGDLDAAASARALEELQRVLAAHDTGEGVLLDSAAWLITARRA